MEELASLVFYFGEFTIYFFYSTHNAEPAREAARELDRHSFLKRSFKKKKNSITGT